MVEEKLNLSDAIFKSLNDIFSRLFSSIDNSIYSLLDNLCFINTDILNNSAISKLLGNNASEGFLLICNALIIGFVLYYAINFLFSHLTYTKISSPSQFFFKCIIFIALMNASLWICTEIINLISIITNLIRDIGKNYFNQAISFSNLINTINTKIYINTEEFSIISFDGIIKSFCTIGLINLLFNYSLRYIMIQIFILVSPFAFLSLISDNSSWFFKAWFRSFISLLLVQVLISIILCLALSLSIDNSNFSKLLFIGIIYALTRANNYMKEIFGGISTDISTGISNIKNLSN
ncbi:MAG: hypothetical protein OSJ66_02570 [Clostridia bacterium]|nr:hypothetical protein [Clostridia bacterium]